MIDLDHRIGSGELLRKFAPYGVAVNKTVLAFGDMAWEGWGPNGLCLVGVERKRIDDLLQSIHSKRLSGYQLPGIVEHYDFGYLVVEGIWRTGEGGQLVVWEGDGRGWTRRNMMARGVHNYLTTLSVQCGVNVWRTGKAQETVEYVVDQYRYWTEKKWEEHRAHQAVYLGKQEGKRLRLGLAGRGKMNRALGPVEKVALVMPGMGEELAYRVGKKFGSVRGMCEADEGKWREVKGVGKVKAGEYVEWLNAGRGNAAGKSRKGE